MTIESERYWEARWRDEKAENERLRPILERLLTITDEMLAAAKDELVKDYRLHRHISDLGIKTALRAAINAACGKTVETAPGDEKS